MMKQNGQLPLVVYNHLLDVLCYNLCQPTQRGEIGAYDFYLDRLWHVPYYGERAGSDMLKLICRCAFADEVLTDAESISIINICHSPEWYKIFKEMNYNEGWN